MRRRAAAVTPLRALTHNSEGLGRAVGATGNGLRKDPVLAVERSGEACVVKLGGELDLYNAPQVREALGHGACDDSPDGSSST